MFSTTVTVNFNCCVLIRPTMMRHSGHFTMTPSSSPPIEPGHPPKRDVSPTPLPTVGLGGDQVRQLFPLFSYEGLILFTLLQYDVISRLLKDRILLLGSEVTDDVANVMVAQLLYLASADPSEDITLYINSPGGSVQAGLAIFDTMQYISCDVSTVCFGMAASMGAFLLAAGAPGKRRSLPNSRIMIHQPLGGSQGEVGPCCIVYCARYCCSYCWHVSNYCRGTTTCALC